VSAVQASRVAALDIDGLSRAPYGMLITTDANGAAHPRLVQHVGVDDELTVWIGTSPRSRNAIHMAERPGLVYAIEDRARHAYASLEAHADTLTDINVRQRRWRVGFEAFFPAGPDGDDYVVVDLRPHAIELLDFTEPLTPEPFGLVPARIEGDQSGAWRLMSAGRGS